MREPSSGKTNKSFPPLIVAPPISTSGIIQVRLYSKGTNHLLCTRKDHMNNTGFHTRHYYTLFQT
jgi:hypothetical protein